MTEHEEELEFLLQEARYECELEKKKERKRNNIYRVVYLIAVVFVIFSITHHAAETEYEQTTTEKGKQ